MPILQSPCKDADYLFSGRDLSPPPLFCMDRAYTLKKRASRYPLTHKCSCGYIHTVSEVSPMASPLQKMGAAMCHLVSFDATMEPGFFHRSAASYDSSFSVSSKTVFPER